MIRRRDDTPIDDQLIEQLVREMADAAPVAPEYHSLVSGRAAVRASGAPPTWPRRLGLVAAVAAAVVLVIAASSWLRPNNRIETGPADSSDEGGTEPVEEGLSGDGGDEAEAPGSWQRYAEMTDPARVQLCIVRVTSGHLLEELVISPFDNAELRSAQPVATTLQNLLGSERVLAAVTDDLVLSQTEVQAVARQDAAYATARAAASEDEGLDVAFDDYVQARAANPLFEPDPDNCWLETAPGREALAGFTGPSGGVDRIACLANAQLAHAVATQIDRPEIDWRDLITTLSQELRWNRGDIDAATELQRDLQDAQVLEDQQFDEAATAIVQRLHDPEGAIGPLGCPLDPQ